MIRSAARLLVIAGLLAGCGGADVADDPEVLRVMQRADRLWSQGDLPLATKNLNSILAENPDFFPAVYRQAIYDLEGDPRVAIETLERAKKLDSDHPGPPFFLAMAYHRLSEFDAANDALERAYSLAVPRLGYSLDRLPGSARDALDAFEQKRFADAATLFDEVLAEHPDNAVLWYLKARSSFLIKKRREATEAARMAIEKGGDLPHPHTLLAQILVARQDHDAAEEELALADALHPTLAYSHHVHGLLHLGRAEYRDAILSFWDAVLADPTVPEHHQLLGNTLQQASRPQASLHLQHVQWATAFLNKKFDRLGPSGQ